ncbi:MAG: DUF45 domain-containing protein [Clostridia bacterium]|nr:DUF45 domain-containing protein [Clostridia bacterium]
MRNIITYSVNKVLDRGLYISVQNGEVTVNAPWYYTKNKIQEAVEEKKSWILKKINEKREENSFEIRPIQIFGVIYELKVGYKNVENIECNIIKNAIVVVLPKKYRKIDSESMMEILTDKVYIKIAERELEGIMEKYRILTKMAPEDYRLEVMSDCLAKVTSNKEIVIDPRIIKYKREVVEYIILHEFCHLKYKIHSKGFNEMIGKYMPKCDKVEVSGLKF